MKYTAKSVESRTTSTGKPMFKVNLADEQGNETELNMFDAVTIGQELDGEIYTNEKGYKNFKSSIAKPSGRPQFDRIIEKKQAGIAEAQARKEHSIKLAQDRSAWMWAKTNAVEIMRQVPDAFSEDSVMIDRLHRLATQIYNLEPIEPF